MENELANLIVDLNQRLASKEQELVELKQLLSQSQERCRELEQKLSGYEENKPPIS